MDYRDEEQLLATDHADPEPPVEVAVKEKKVPWYTFVGDFFNILKAFIGTNYQALPFAFKNSGLAVGIFGVFFIACLTDYCCQILIKCKHIVIGNVIAEDGGDMDEEEKAQLKSSLNKSVGYGDLARRAFGGKWGDFMYHLVEIAVLFTQYLTCVAYFIFIGNTIYEMYPLVPALVPLQNATYPALYSAPSDLDPSNAGVPILAWEEFNQHHHHRVRRSLSQDDFDPYSFEQNYIHNESGRLLEDLADEDHVSHLLNLKNTLLRDYNNIIDNIDNNNVSTTTTSAPTTTPNVTVPPTPQIYKVTSAPDLKLLCLYPLAFFLLTSIIRKMRHIAPFSVIASIALAIGAVSVFAFLCSDFAITAGGFSWWKVSTLPLFVGQLISAYEGIGCIVPIESSMEGNQHVFRWFLHANVFIVFVILTAFGSVGYLRYGEDVSQLIVRSIPQHTTMSLLVDITLIISVLFTYPLQCFPVIEIVENYLFAPGACLGPPMVHPPHPHNHVQADDEEDVEEEEGPRNDLELSVASVVTMVPQKVAAWKRNVVRVLITLSTLGVAVLTRNAYAYLAAFSGALACSLLAYILPCVIHLKLCSRTSSLPRIILHVIIICLACLASIFTLTIIFYSMAKGKMI